MKDVAELLGYLVMFGLFLAFYVAIIFIMAFLLSNAWNFWVVAAFPTLPALTTEQMVVIIIVLNFVGGFFKK